MKILTLNCGSSSLKFELFESGKEPKSIASGHIDRIGTDKCKLSFKAKYKDISSKSKAKTHKAAVKEAFETLIKTETIKDKKEITLISHRVVHGGELYDKPVKIDAKVIRNLLKLSALAPLHNPINIEGIRAAKAIHPRVKQVAVFDTSYYRTLPEKAYLYAIPRDLYEKHAIRRYGFHGINHEYVTNKAIKQLKKKNLKIISVHLGNGSSITASIGGKALETSMGYTPLEGLPMGTRSGTIDPAIVLQIQKLKRLNRDKTEDFLNQECGLLALSGFSSDMRDIYQTSLKKGPQQKRAKETIGYLSYQIAKITASYTAILGGLDVLVFTGGMGEKAFYVREKALSQLKHLKRFKTLVIPADEEYQMALLSQKIK